MLPPTGLSGTTHLTTKSRDWPAAHDCPRVMAAVAKNNLARQNCGGQMQRGRLALGKMQGTSWLLQAPSARPPTCVSLHQQSHRSAVTQRQERS